MSSLTVRTRQVRGVVVVDLEGEITLGDTNRHLHNSIHQLIKEGKRQIILNLANVKRNDSSSDSTRLRSLVVVSIADRTA